MIPYPKIFIVGCPRSGTTWIRNMLQQHSDVIAIPTETHIFNIVYRPLIELPKLSIKKRLKKIKSILRKFGLRTLLTGYSTDDIFRDILNRYNYFKTSKRVGLHHFINQTDFNKLVESARLRPDLNNYQKACHIITSFFDNYYMHERGSGRQLLIEKTPGNLYYVDVILQSMPEARIIEVIRDCRDVCASFLAKSKREAWATKSIKSISIQWENSIKCGEKYRSIKEFKDRIHLVRYEELRMDTNVELERILAFAKLNYDYRLVDEIAKKTHISNYKRGEGLHVYKGVVGDWVNRLQAEDIREINSIAGATMDRLGYT